MRRRACVECSSRGLLLSILAGHIDRAVNERSGGRARDILALGDGDLARAVSPSDPSGPLRRSRSRAAHERLLEALDSTGCWSCCAHTGGYPRDLAALGEAQPRALFAAGGPSVIADLDPSRCATIVGSRRASAYGREVAHELSRLLAGCGLTVISGMALGIDSAAHEGALLGGGPTVAVLGAGAERPYPRSRRHLYERIRKTGLVLSELPPGSPTFRWMFPARNRLMAALAPITVVVEAAERSGSLITAEMALEGGRQVGAVPGPVTSWRSGGTNKLLADGAAVVRGAQDVLDLLLGPGAVVASEAGPPLPEAELEVLRAVEGGSVSPDAVAAASGIAFGSVVAALGRLERGGYLRSDVAGRYARTSRRAAGAGSAAETRARPPRIPPTDERPSPSTIGR